MSVFIALVLAIGFYVGEYYGTGGYGGIAYAGIVAVGMSLFSYFGGDKVALLSSGAQEIRKEDNPYVWRLVENLAITAGLPMPRVYIIPDGGMNAFATGRDPQHASIALTAGIINNLENEELEGVIAHELSHVKNFDTRIMMIVVVLVGVIALLADFMWRVRLFGGGGRRDSREGGQIQLIFMIVGAVLLILSPIIAELIKLAISRRREYLADASAVLMTRYAEGLARALEKIGAQGGGKLARANSATAHLFLTNPFGQDGVVAKLFSTHPPIQDRIAALRRMSGVAADVTNE